MKKLLLVLPFAALLAACGSTQDPYERRAENERRYQEEAVDRALKSRPSWMTRLPVSSSAVFAAASGQADTYDMAVHTARTNALAEICYSADGRVTSQTKQYATGNTKSSSIEKVTRTNCNAVDVTGIETYGAKDVGDNPVVIRTGRHFTAYVLVALPVGDANVQRRYRDDLRREQSNANRATEAFKELERN